MVNTEPEAVEPETSDLEEPEAVPAGEELPLPPADELGPEAVGAPGQRRVDRGPAVAGAGTRFTGVLEEAEMLLSPVLQPMPPPVAPMPMTLAESRIAVTAALNHAAAFEGQLRFLAERLPLGSRHRQVAENARRLAGETYNSLAAAAGLLAL